jgi:hypothetical protein
MRTQISAVVLLIVALLIAPMSTWAEDSLTVDVTVQASCEQVDGQVEFSITVGSESPPFAIWMDFGDGIWYEAGVSESSFSISHIYPAQDEYSWSLVVEDEARSTEPSPPLLTLLGGEAIAEFTARVEGGQGLYVYEWDLDGDPGPDEGLSGPEASRSYVEAGEFQASVQVTDACGFSDSASLLVIVLDPEEEPEAACHPMALRIAEHVSELFPTRADRPYSCEDILAIFNGEVFGFQVGFGRMWHAYQLSQVIDDLTWEQIRDWHLENGGWGILLQLNRFADLLETHGILDLMEMVASEEYTLGDIRAAVRAVTRYQADFEDALSRLDAGASPGEIGQFYRLAQTLGEDPVVLEEYLGEGFTLAELRHAASLGERLGASWTDVMEARDYGHSWGAIGQAYRLADEEHSAGDILAIGVQEYREQVRELERATREQDRAARQTEADGRTGARLAEQFGVDLGEVTNLYQGTCAQSWGCVRDTLRNQARSGSGRSERTAAQIASRYGYSVDEVLAVYSGACGGEWSCVRAHFRNLARSGGGQGNNR